MVGLDKNRHIFLGKFVIEQSDGTDEYTVSAMPMSDKELDMLAGIVRCRDCVHYSESEWVLVTDVCDVCHFWHGEPTKVSPDGYCAWGKRKEDE